MKANVCGGGIKFAHSQLVCCSSFFFYYFFLFVRFSVLDAKRRRKKGEKKKSSSFFHRATYVSSRKLADRSDGRKSIMPPRNKLQFFFLSAISREGKDHTGSTIQIYIYIYRVERPIKSVFAAWLLVLSIYRGVLCCLSFPPSFSVRSNCGIVASFCCVHESVFDLVVFKEH